MPGWSGSPLPPMVEMSRLWLDPNEETKKVRRTTRMSRTELPRFLGIGPRYGPSVSITQVIAAYYFTFVSFLTSAEI